MEFHSSEDETSPISSDGYGNDPFARIPPLLACDPQPSLWLDIPQEGPLYPAEAFMAVEEGLHSLIYHLELFGEPLCDGMGNAYRRGCVELWQAVEILTGKIVDVIFDGMGHMTFVERTLPYYRPGQVRPGTSSP